VITKCIPGVLKVSLPGYGDVTGKHCCSDGQAQAERGSGQQYSTTALQHYSSAATVTAVLPTATIKNLKGSETNHSWCPTVLAAAILSERRVQTVTIPHACTPVHRMILFHCYDAVIDHVTNLRLSHL
jgi:hypothetical protein